MTVSTEISSLAISVVSGALKLGRQLDQVHAEEVALRKAVPLAFPSITYNPSDTAMRRELRKLALSTRNLDPDPLGDDRSEFAHLPQQGTAELFALCSRCQLLDNMEAGRFRPDKEFSKALLVRSDAWDLSDEDIRRYTYFVAAGADLRGNSLSFRVAATTLDVLTEVAAQNARFVINHEPTRKTVETILTRFCKPELAEFADWGSVLRHALSVTLTIAIDEREALAGGREWIDRALAAVAQARDRAPNGDDFVLGLFQGRGFGELLRGILTEAADHLSEGDAEAWEEILADVLETAAGQAEADIDFQAFFQENWHSLVRAGFASLREHGPKLLDPDDEILKATLNAAVRALGEAFDQGVPNGETFAAVVEAAVGVFADPAVLEPAIREPWLRDMIASVGETVRDDGLRKAFSQPALEGYARDTLSVLSRYPEIFADDSELVGKFLSDTLGRMSRVDNFGVGPLADIVVEQALTAIAMNPALLDVNYAGAIGEIAGGLAKRVASGGIAGLHADAIIEEVTEVLASNEALFLRARDGLAQALVDAVLDAVGDDPKGALVGEAVVTTVRNVLDVAATAGNLLPADLGAVEERAREIVAAGLDQAAQILGRKLAQSDVHAALTELVARWVQGEPIPDLTSQEFEALFVDIAVLVTARAA